MTSNNTDTYVSPDELGIGPASQDDYYQPNGTDSVDLSGTLTKDIGGLDTQVERTTTADSNTAEGDKAPDNTQQQQAVSDDFEKEPLFQKPAPIDDWQEQAKQNDFKGITTEAEFREALDVKKYVHEAFYNDPQLNYANQILTDPNTEAKTFLEVHFFTTKEDWEDASDVEAKVAKFVDEDGELTEQGKKIAGHAKTKLQARVDNTALSLQQEAKDYYKEVGAYKSTLEQEILALPKDIYTAAEKRELANYINSGKYDEDATGLDAKGNAINKGADHARKMIANAQKLNPVFQAKVAQQIYEDAKKMAVDEFIKKHFK